MKILLVGEYSAFYKNLKEGLMEAGQEVTLLADGDGWKQIKGADDVLFHSFTEKGYLGKIYHGVLEPLIHKSKLTGYDVVQIINPVLYSQYINKYMLKQLVKHNKKSFLTAAGYDYYMLQTYKQKRLRYCMFDDEKKMGYYDHFNCVKESNEYLASCVNGIIPVSYEYSLGYEKMHNLKNIIPLPINTKKISYKENIMKNNKLVVFHGISREEEKGTRYIRAALEHIRDKYPGDIELIITERMPLEEYMKVMQKTNIVVDQCKSYGYGMNALIAMAQGKVVLTGVEEETIRAFKIKDIPACNIRPDVQQIEQQMEKLLEDRYQIREKGYLSRKFVEEFHDYYKVARQYIECWKQ